MTHNRTARLTLPAAAALAFAAVAVCDATEPAAAGQADQAGRYRLTTVNGAELPMAWHRVETHEGGQLTMTWVSGRAELGRDGRFTIAIVSAVTGSGVRGLPTVRTSIGTWRSTAAGQVELAFDDGSRVLARAAVEFRHLTIGSLYQDLDGERRAATLRFERDTTTPYLWENTRQ